MSTWKGGETRLWESAIGEGGRSAAWIGRVRDRVSARGVAAVLLGAIGLGVVMVGVLQTPGHAAVDAEVRGGGTFGVDGLSMQVLAQPPVSSGRTRTFGGFGGTDELLAGLQFDRAEPDHGPSDSARRIAYSASVRLTGGDARTVAERARGLLDASDGEYVESVSVSGEGSDATARLTLRVRAERLEGVLAAIRGLGDVVAEEVSARDLSDRLVDLEARLRNERRTEAELLELMSTHESIDLEGLVRLRSELGRVRERIETMEASRVNAERLVALATIELRIVGRQPLPEVKVESRWQRLREGVGAYWDRGVVRLGRSLGDLLSFVVGRVVWWLPGAVLLFAAWRVWKRRGVVGG